MNGGTFILDKHKANITGTYYGTFDYLDKDGNSILNNSNIIKIKIYKDSIMVTWDQILYLWKNSNKFIKFFIDLIKSTQFDNFFWECPPINLKNIQYQNFECYIINSNNNFGKASDNSFKSYFNENPSKKIISFYNPSRSCLLIVPCPLEEIEKNCYLNISTFIKHAPKPQIYILWKQISTLLKKQLKNNHHIWLNTHGLGVPWLHVRLDTIPKYYHLSYLKK